MRISVEYLRREFPEGTVCTHRPELFQVENSLGVLLGVFIVKGGYELKGVWKFDYGRSPDIISARLMVRQCMNSLKKGEYRAW